MVNHRLPWTSEEENFLKVNASKLTLAELAEALGRTEDTAFYTNLGTGFDNQVNGIDVQPDGKILLAGSFSDFNGNARAGITRLNSNGTEDVAFYTNLGTATTGFIEDIKILPSSKIIVGGWFTSFNGNTRNKIVCLNNDGTEDTAFYSNVGTGFNGDIMTVAVDGDKIILGGSFTQLNGNTRNRITRLNADGTEDTSLYTQINGGAAARVRNIVKTGDYIYVSGDFYTCPLSSFPNLLNTLPSVVIIHIYTNQQLRRDYEVWKLYYYNRWQGV